MISNLEALENLTELQGLSENEKKLALQILQEFSTSGSSQKYQELKYRDYKEIPVDIETFLTNDNYLGKAWKDATGKSKLYPFWLEQLKKLFPTNVDTDYNTFLESGARGIGKAIRLSDKLLTDKGFIEMRDVTYDTKVYGKDGNLHNVIGIYPQGEIDVYEIEFTDGVKTTCCLNHLWEVEDRFHATNHKHIPTTKILALKDIIGKNLKQTNGYRFKLPICNPVNFPHEDTFISPYMLGCLLGDGTLSESQYIQITSQDEFIIDYFNEELNDYNYELRATPNSIDYRIMSMVKGETNCHTNLYSLKIKELGLLGTNSKTKFIPKQYLYNDVESRIALLQGLLDTDGTANKSPRRCDGTYSYNISFSTISSQLKDDVVWLVQSLGGIARVKEKESYWYKKDGTKKKCNNHYCISIQLPSSIQPFRLKRKVDLYNSCSHREPARFFKSITKLPQKEECQCIRVDADDHLFLLNKFIVTHNSEVACGAVGTYLMYRVMCMKNPNAFFHLKQTEKICFAFMNIKLALAEEIAISKFQKTVQMSPWFMSKGTMTTYKNTPYWIPPDPIKIIIGSQSDDVIGQPIYFAFFDEISFIKNQDIDKQKKKAKDMIDTAIGGMFTRFIHGGKNPTVLAVASSKRSEQSFMEEYIKTLSKTSSGSTLVIDKPVWEVKPKGTYSDEIFYVGLGNKFLESIVIPDNEINNLDMYRDRGYKILEVPIDFKAKFLEDIERNLCDFAGISSSSMNKYMSGAVVSDCINEEYKNPFPDIIEVGNGPEDTAQYQNFFKLENIPKELISKPLYIHLDMSISGDMTGIAGVWIIGKKVNQGEDQSKDLNFRLAFSVSVKAPKGRQISFEKNRKFIRWLKSIGFKIKHITSDTYQAYDLQQQLSAEGFECSILSVDRVDNNICQPYQYLRSSIYEKRFQMYRSNRLFDEFIDIQRDMNTGKIDHSPNFHKDALDAVCGATFTASKYVEQYAFDYGEDLETTTKVSNSVNQEQEISQAFQEELIKMFDPIQRQQQQQQKQSQNSSQIQSTQQQKQTNIDFGMGPAIPVPTNYINQGIIVF